jgi:hypothetical protein
MKQKKAAFSQLRKIIAIASTGKFKIFISLTDSKPYGKREIVLERERI